MKKILFAVVAGALSFAAQAQVPSYGPSINLEQAKKAIAAGQVHARKNGWPIAIAVVDTAGMLVAFEKLDDTQSASMDIAIDKARSAAIYRRPTKVMQDALAAGGAGVRFLNLRAASTVDGGLPIIVNGKVIGGIGTSGVNGDQDAEVSKAGADSLK